MKPLLDAALAGGDTVPLQQAMITYYASLQETIRNLRAQASVAAYEEALSRVEQIDDALAASDMAGMREAFDGLDLAQQHITSLSAARREPHPDGPR